MKKGHDAKLDINVLPIEAVHYKFENFEEESVYH